MVHSHVLAVEVGSVHCVTSSDKMHSCEYRKDMNVESPLLRVEIASCDFSTS